MIRFCDKEVNCIMINELNRSVLFSYFLNGHRDEIICVLDETGAYYGIINYNMLLKNQDIHDAVSRTHVTIGETMWQEARTYFFYYEKTFGEIPLLPVVDSSGNLLCFAYEDEYANRQVRMLRELTENEELLQFYDIYPKYDCVTIHECNELAWYFAKYLQKIGVPVRVEGIMWSFFDEWETFDCLEYRNYTIYAEGTWQKNPNLAEYLLRSVSVCFECIDKIYEENIYAGKIMNADGDFNTMLQKLQDKDVFILGIDNEAQDVYDILLGNGIKAKGFIKEQIKENQKHLLNQKLYRLREAVSSYENAVFIEPREKSSAWGLGLTDNYDYYSFTRNERFFLIEDYIKVEPTMLLNTLKGKNVVLVGEAELCECVYEYLKKKQPEIASIHYYDLIEEKQSHNMPDLMEKDIKQDAIYISVFYQYWDEIYASEYATFKENRKTYVGYYLKKIEQRDEITEYFSNNGILVKIEKEKNLGMKEEIMPAGIIVGAINPFSGNVFMHGILDGHPELISLRYGFLNKELLRLFV